MATITRYVNPDSADGGDGTTNATTGANRAYASLADWEGHEQQNLDTGNSIAECICETNGTADTTAVTIDGWTTSATDYIAIKTSAGHRHGGKWNTGKYSLTPTIANETRAVTVSEEFVRIDGLQVNAICGASIVWIVGIGSSTLAACEFRISNCIVKITKGGYTITYASGIEFINGNASSVAHFWNNIVYDFITGTAGNQRGIRFEAGTNGSVLTAYNNTVVNCGTGFSNGAGSGVTFTAKNCGAASCTTGFSANVTQTTCSATAPTFVDDANDDFHLASGDTAWKNAGTSDPDSGLFSDDIDGQTRSGTWDIGADEYVAAAGGLSILVRRAYSQAVNRAATY